MKYIELFGTKRLPMERDRLSSADLKILDAYKKRHGLDDDEAIGCMAEEIAQEWESSRFNGAGYGPSDSTISEVLDYDDDWIIKRYQKLRDDNQKAVNKLLGRNK